MMDKIVEVDYAECERRVVAQLMDDDRLKIACGRIVTGKEYLEEIARQGELIGPGDFFVLPYHPTRSMRKHDQALKNAQRPGLKPRRRKHWLNVAKKWGIQFYSYEKVGVSIGNPCAIAKVRINE